MAGLLLPALALAQPAPQPANDIDVVVTAPMPGSSAERDKVATNTRVLRSDDVQRTGPASALRALDERVGGIQLNQTVANPFEPNLIFRGYEASPLSGNPQGLAIYLNGSRFNQPFGDTTQWDLIPDIAIDRIDLANSPAFGLNALGGAITVKLKDGFSYHGGQLELSGGSFGRVQTSGQYGVQSGNTAVYIAGSGLNENGWRQNSPSQLRQIYGDIGWRGDKSELHFNVLGANNILVGSGTTPVDLLAVKRNATFTGPNEIRNKYLRLSLLGTHEVTDRVTVQASAYYSNSAQRDNNGNASAAQACGDDPALLCNGNDTPLTARDRTRIPGFQTPSGVYSQLDQTAIDSNGYGASLQATHRSELFGRANRALVGVSYDGGSTLFSARSSVGGLTADRNFIGPGTVISLADGSITPVRLAATNGYYGVYASDALDVTDALTVTLSGRVNAAQIDLADQTGTALNGRHSYFRFNPAVGITYRITQAVSFYGGYAESNRTPTPSELSCASPSSPCSLANFFVSDPALKQVVAHTFEAGLRGKFTVGDSARVTWNAGVFRTDSRDDILFTSSAELGRGYFQNVGATRRQGLEAGVNVRQGSLLAFVDYAYTDATFRTAFTAGSQNNPLADANGQIQVRPGDQIPGIAAHRLKFGAQYDVTPSWTIGTTGILSSGQVLQGDASNLNPKTGDYFVLNANTSYRVTDNVELFGLVQNLTNTKYATYGGFSPVALAPITQAPGTTNTRSLSPGAPVAGYGGVRVSF